MKLTKIEQNAKRICDIINQRGELMFAAQWKKTTYGYCPTIHAWNQVVGKAGGCGYDKESAALAGFLLFLFEAPEKIKDESYQDLILRSPSALINSTSAAGFDATAEALKKNGWLLTKDNASDTLTVYLIKKI